MTDPEDDLAVIFHSPRQILSPFGWLAPLVETLPDICPKVAPTYGRNKVADPEGLGRQGSLMDLVKSLICISKRRTQTV